MLQAKEKSAKKRGKKRRARKKPPAKDRNVYVIELDAKVLADERFRAKNPDHAEGKACLYVGMTARDPEVRLEQHLNGVKASRYVRKYGRWLRKRLYQRFNPMTYRQACRKEVELARALREKGHAVWQN